MELAAAGMRQEQIAAELGMTRSGVSKLLHRTERRYVELIKQTLEQIKARQTARLDRVYEEAMDAWERSKSDGKSIKTIESSTGRARTETTERSQTGDARFLDQARGALSDIRRIWRLDESDKQDQHSTTNVTIRVEYSEHFFGHRAVDGVILEPSDATGMSYEDSHGDRETD